MEIVVASLPLYKGLLFNQTKLDWEIVDYFGEILFPMRSFSEEQYWPPEAVRVGLEFQRRNSRKRFKKATCPGL